MEWGNNESVDMKYRTKRVLSGLWKEFDEMRIWVRSWSLWENGEEFRDEVRIERQWSSLWGGLCVCAGGAGLFLPSGAQGEGRPASQLIWDGMRDSQSRNLEGSFVRTGPDTGRALR